MRRLTLAVFVAIIASLSAAPQAYSVFAKWTSTPVAVYINPTNADVDPAAAEAAIVSAMQEWNTNSGSAFRYTYVGRSNDTTVQNDGRTVVLFRNASDNGALASTYSWYDRSVMFDSDIVFWDASYAFFTGTDGCSGGAYIEDIAAHELGHALGLDHSGAADATMYPTYYYCSQEMRTLAADDMAGAQALYPGTATEPPPPPPPSEPTLTARVSKAKGLPTVELAWAGLDGDNIAIYRNTNAIAVVPNSGKYTDTFERKHSGSYLYQVCGAVCTNPVQVKF